MSKKRKTTKLDRIADLAEKLGITDRTIRAWVKRGCPCRRIKRRGKNGGRRALWFDESRVRDWLASNDILVPGKETPQPSTVERPANVSDPDLPKSGIVGALARLRAMERIAYATFLQAVQAKESSDRVRAKERIYVEAHQALRRTEKEIPLILEKRGEMIPLEIVLVEQAKIDLAVKNQFLTLPRKLAPVLAGIDDPGEIEETLQNEIDDCLRHIASGAVLSNEPTPNV